VEWSKKRDVIHIHHHMCTALEKKESHGFVFFANFGTFCWRMDSAVVAWLAFGEAFSKVRAFVRSGRVGGE
jgi:hypothetical protein